MLATSPEAAPAQTPPKGGAADAQLAALAKAYLDVAFKLNPLAATSVGMNTYDPDLGDSSATSVAAMAQPKRSS